MRRSRERSGSSSHYKEKNGPNIIPHTWVKELFEKDLPDAAIVETNTYYEGDRYTTEQHRETLKRSMADILPGGYPG